MPTPMISIVMPLRDADATVRDAIDSIHAQTWRDWEQIAITWNDPPNRLSRTDPRYSVENFYRMKCGHLGDKGWVEGRDFLLVA